MKESVQDGIRIIALVVTVSLVGMFVWGQVLGPAGILVGAAWLIAGLLGTLTTWQLNGRGTRR